MRAFSYAWSLPVTWQRWRSHHSIHYSRKIHTARKLHVSIFYRTEPELLPIEVLYCGKIEFGHFCSCDLYPMTFIYELHPYLSEIYQVCRNKFPTSRLLKVIVRQTDRTEMIHYAASWVVKNRLMPITVWCVPVRLLRLGGVSSASGVSASKSNLRAFLRPVNDGVGPVAAACRCPAFSRPSAPRPPRWSPSPARCSGAALGRTASTGSTLRRFLGSLALACVCE